MQTSALHTYISYLISQASNKELNLTKSCNNLRNLARIIPQTYTILLNLAIILLNLNNLIDLASVLLNLAYNILTLSCKYHAESYKHHSTISYLILQASY